MAVLRLVEKPDCPLCEEAWPVVRRVAADLELPVERVSIEADPALERYRDQVPVVLWNEEPLARLRVREEVLRRRLKGRLKSRGS